MEIQEIREVMNKYKKAWENQDSNLIIECFVKNGIYQESPLAKPYKGHKEIKKFWNREVVNRTKNIQFKLKKCDISKDGKTGFAEWECTNRYLGKKGHMVGIMLLKMKGNKISYLNEYWKTKRAK
jgi:ketosteroid isomerase-like protein